MSKLINESSEWQQLESHASAMSQTHLRDLLQDNARCDGLTAEFQGIFMDYSRENVALETMDMLEKLAKAAGVEAKRDAMASGVHINNTENRAVMHMALRAPKSSKIIVDGEDVVPGVHAVLEKINNFSDRVRNNTWVGATGKPLTTILSIGIVGS